MSREVHVRFCESREVRSLPATHLVVHCVTERQARNLVAAIGDRMEQVGLRLHPDKTKIVYCKDQRRRLDYEGLTAFTFLGFTFRSRTARSKSGALFASFQPAISNDARNKISEQIRRWRCTAGSGSASLSWHD